MAKRKASTADAVAKLQNVISQEMVSCIGAEGGELSTARTALKSAYLGLGYSTDEAQHKDGWSTYVDRSVMETVEWAKPALMRVFASNDEIVRFEALKPGGEQAAKDATDYVNQVIFQQNAYRLVHDVLTDGLMQRIGWAKVYYEDREEEVAHEYEGLGQEEAIALLMDYPDATDVEIEEEDGEGFCLKFKCMKQIRGVRVDPIPSENVIIAQDARDIETCRFIAHWEHRMAGDLLNDGYTQAQIDELPKVEARDNPDYPEGQMQREVNAADANTDTSDESTQTVVVYEAWLYCDVNGDGKPERVKVVYGGDGATPIVLDWEEWTMPRPPIFPACSVPLPHSVVGLGLADLVMDMQRLRSELWRGLLDNIYLANHGELVVSKGQNGSVNMDLLLSRRAGGVYEIEGDASITSLPVAPVSADAITALQMTDRVNEARTGVGANLQGVQADALQNSATGAAIQEEAINQRNELVARNYAEFFYKPLATYTLHLLSRYHDRKAEVMLNGRPLQTRPSDWSPDMAVRVSVGLGTGNRAKQAAGLQQIMQVQTTAMQALGPASPVKLRHVMYSAKRLAAALGFQDVDAFFGTDEETMQAEQAMAQQAAQPQPDPNQALVQIEQAKAQAQAQKAQADVQIKGMELEQKRREGQAKVLTDAQMQEREHEREMARIAAQMRLDEAKANAQIAIMERKAALEMALAQMKVDNDAALEGRRIELEHELKSLVSSEMAANAANMPHSSGQEGM